MILSDGDLSSLANMKLNLGMNELSVRSDLLEANTCEKILVQCKYLPWESAPESELQDIMPDIVLGADVIYDPSCIPHLIRVLAILLDQGKSYSHDQNDSFEPSLQNRKINGTPQQRKTLHVDLEKSNDDSMEFEGTSLCTNNRNPKHWCQATKKSPMAYIASVIRNIETFYYFLTLAEQANLTVTDLTGEIKRLDLLPYMQSYRRSDVRLFSVSFSC